MTANDYHRQGIALFRHLYESKCNDYDQLRQLSTMAFGASMMLDADSPEAQELTAMRQKVEARINQVLGVDRYMQAA